MPRKQSLTVLWLLWPYCRGEYKAGIGADGSCNKCARGASTPTEASTTIFDCTRVLPGFYAAAMDVGAVMEAKSCPQVGVRAAWFGRQQGTPSHQAP